MPIPLSEYECAASRIDAAILRGEALGAAPLVLTPAISADLYGTIFRQRYALYIRRTAHVHRDAGALAAIRAIYARGVPVADIARRSDVNFSPYLLCRLLIESELGLGSKSRVAELVRSPALLRERDARLARELEACIACDEQCGPAVDRRRAAVGDEFELRLLQQLRERGIPFAAERELLLEGFPKTPDVRLVVPIGLLEERRERRGGGGGGGGGAGGEELPASPRIVHWIDSKAVFGDPVTHRDKLEQLNGYVNRFGPGSVIYWNGFVDEIRDMTPPGILVLDALPDLWVLPGDAAVRTLSSLALPLPTPAPLPPTASAL